MKHKKIAVLGFMIAVAIALQIFESYIPVPVPIPGGKLGFANIVTLIVLCVFGFREALIVSLLRSVLGSLLYGGVVSVIYSFFGALFSTLTAFALYKCRFEFSLTGIGVAAALMHNLAQIFIAAVLLNNVAVFTYYPVLMVVSVVCGGVTGFSAGCIVNNTAIYRNLM